MTLKDKFTYQLLNVMSRQIRRLPYLLRFKLSNKLGAFAYNLLTIRKQEAFNNIKKAFPNKPNNWINNILKRIPILRTIYSAILQMTETFSSKDNNKKSVVLIEYPRKGVWAVGFATKENKGQMSKKTNKNLINVFVPTTPNPTSGFLLMFPVDEVIHLDMSFEEASKFIVSAGSSNPN